MNFKKILSISRPRFWIYVLGTFLVGAIAAGNPIFLDQQEVFLGVALLLFFTFPANILIYGVNDIYDYETDKLNPKKSGYEELVAPKENNDVIKAILWSCLPFLALFYWLPDYAAVALLVFVITGVFYSAGPIRAKSKPPLDIIFSATIYISPAVVAFMTLSPHDISWIAVAGGLMWAFAMQSYSAIPDIEADQAASVTTLATFLGRHGTLLFCLVMYGAAGIVAYQYIGIIGLLMGAIYVSLMIIAMIRPQSIFSIYKKFPILNASMGMILFFVISGQFLV